MVSATPRNEYTPAAETARNSSSSGPAVLRLNDVTDIEAAAAHSYKPTIAKTHGDFQSDGSAPRSASLPETHTWSCCPNRQGWMPYNTMGRVSAQIIEQARIDLFANGALRRQRNSPPDGERRHQGQERRQTEQIRFLAFRRNDDFP